MWFGTVKTNYFSIQFKDIENTQVHINHWNNVCRRSHFFLDDAVVVRGNLHTLQNFVINCDLVGVLRIMFEDLAFSLVGVEVYWYRGFATLDDLTCICGFLCDIWASASETSWSVSWFRTLQCFLCFHSDVEVFIIQSNTRFFLERSALMDCSLLQNWSFCHHCYHCLVHNIGRHSSWLRTSCFERCVDDHGSVRFSMQLVHQVLLWTASEKLPVCAEHFLLREHSTAASLLNLTFSV